MPIRFADGTARAIRSALHLARRFIARKIQYVHIIGSSALRIWHKLKCGRSYGEILSVRLTFLCHVSERKKSLPQIMYEARLKLYPCNGAFAYCSGLIRS